MYNGMVSLFKDSFSLLSLLGKGDVPNSLL